MASSLALSPFKFAFISELKVRFLVRFEPIILFNSLALNTPPFIFIFISPTLLLESFNAVIVAFPLILPLAIAGIATSFKSSFSLIFLIWAFISLLAILAVIIPPNPLISASKNSKFEPISLALALAVISPYNFWPIIGSSLVKFGIFKFRSLFNVFSSILYIEFKAAITPTGVVITLLALAVRPFKFRLEFALIVKFCGKATP